MHADLVGQGGLRLDRVRVEVLEELETTVAVRRLEHGDLGVVAVEADGGVGPLAADRVTAEDGQAEVGEEGDRRFEVADGDADVLELDGHALARYRPSVVHPDAGSGSQSGCRWPASVNLTVVPSRPWITST